MDPLASWARVLERYVNERGQVDFAGLARDPEPLDRYVAYVASVDPARSEAFDEASARLAHYINAYNAMSMYAVIERGIPRTNAGLRKIPFFFLRRYQIAGMSQSLARYEKMIRELGDPRVHFALNCMSVGCPRLPRTPFRGDQLDAELERAAEAFFADAQKCRVDRERRVVFLSEILKFYRPEFEQAAGSLVAFVNRYLEPDVPDDYSVEFIPYDWTFNRWER